MKILEKLVPKVHAEQFAEAGRHDPYKNFKYLVEITGNMVFAKAGFSSVSGLNMNTDEITYREGGDNHTPRKMPGLTNFDDITLERGMSEDRDMWEFASKVFTLDSPNASNDPGFRASVIVKLKDRAGNIVKQWEVQRVWFKTYETGEFDGEGSEVMIERIVLAQEGFNKTLG